MTAVSTRVRPGVAARRTRTRKPRNVVAHLFLGALIVCTLIYMAVAAVMTGVVPYLELASPAPVAVAIDRMGLEWANVPLAAAPGAIR